MVLLLSLIIALLPLRLMGGVVGTVPGDATPMVGCSSLDMVTMEAGVENSPCPGHDLGGGGVGNCCGDHCGSSAQLFPSVDLSLYVPSFPLYFQELFLSFPTVFLSPRHRPPLSIS